MIMNTGELALKKVEKVVDLVLPVAADEPGRIELDSADIGRSETLGKRSGIPLPAASGGFHQSVHDGQILRYPVEEIINLIHLVTNTEPRPGKRFS